MVEFQEREDKEISKKDTYIKILEARIKELENLNNNLEAAAKSDRDAFSDLWDKNKGLEKTLEYLSKKLKENEQSLKMLSHLEVEKNESIDDITRDHKDDAIRFLTLRCADLERNYENLFSDYNRLVSKTDKVRICLENCLPCYQTKSGEYRFFEGTPLVKPQKFAENTEKIFPSPENVLVIKSKKGIVFFLELYRDLEWNIADHLKESLDTTFSYPIADQKETLKVLIDQQKKNEKEIAEIIDNLEE